MGEKRIAFIDSETTGLDPRLHVPWEIALILRDETHDDEEYVWQLDVGDLSPADPRALMLSGFRERRAQRLSIKSADEFAPEFARLTEGAIWVGAVPSFDEERLRHLLWGAGESGCWHCQLVDVETLMSGKLGAQPPWNWHDMAKQLGVNADDFEVHTALGDARMARACYDAVYGINHAETNNDDSSPEKGR